MSDDPHDHFVRLGKVRGWLQGMEDLAVEGDKVKTLQQWYDISFNVATRIVGKSKKAKVSK